MRERRRNEHRDHTLAAASPLVGEAGEQSEPGGG